MMSMQLSEWDWNKWFDDCDISMEMGGWGHWELCSSYLSAPSSCPEEFNVGVAAIVELLLLSVLSAFSDLSLLSPFSPFSPFSLWPFFGPRFFGGGAFEIHPWQYHLPRGTCRRRSESEKLGWERGRTNDYLYHWRNITVVVICTRTDFAINHLSDRLLSMTTANDTFTITSRFVNTLVTIPAEWGVT